MVAEKDKCIESIIAGRNHFINLMDSLTIEQLNKIPEGFNNNILWNFGHIIVAQQLLCYKMAGQSLKIDEALVAKYSKGTKPDAFIDEKELAYLKQQAVTLIDALPFDIEKGMFDNYSSYTTSFGVTLTSIDDAVKFLTIHEGLHLGYAMALKRVVNR